MSKTLRADDRAEPHAPGDDDTVRRPDDRRSRRTATPRIGELAAVRRHLGADASAQAEPARRVEQVVAAVIAEAERQRRDEEGARVLDAALLNTPRSSVASNSPPYVQVHFFCQMKLLCRSMLPASSDRLAPHRHRTSGARPKPAGSASGRAAGSCERRNWTPSNCSLVPATPRTVSAPSGLKKLRSVQLASTRAPCPVP